MLVERVFCETKSHSTNHTRFSKARTSGSARSGSASSSKSTRQLEQTIRSAPCSASEATLRGKAMSQQVSIPSRSGPTCTTCAPVPGRKISASWPHRFTLSYRWRISSSGPARKRLLRRASAPPDSPPKTAQMPCAWQAARTVSTAPVKSIQSAFRGRRLYSGKQTSAAPASAACAIRAVMCATFCATSSATRIAATAIRKGEAASGMVSPRCAGAAAGRGPHWPRRAAVRPCGPGSAPGSAEAPLPKAPRPPPR